MDYAKLRGKGLVLVGPPATTDIFLRVLAQLVGPQRAAWLPLDLIVDAPHDREVLLCTANRLDRQTLSDAVVQALIGRIDAGAKLTLAVESVDPGAVEKLSDRLVRLECFRPDSN